MTDDDFCLTTGSVAAKAHCDQGIVRTYADAGWIECRRLANGVRLFRPSAIEKVRRLRAERLSRRGKYVRSPQVEAST
jgi:DNA-binding transcriptional MerR regulator